MTNSTRRPIRRSKKPAADLGSLMTFRPFFAGKGWTLTLLSAGSFLAGIAEAGMLVIVAKLALSIGGTSSLSGGLGPIESIKLTTGQMFLLALGSVVARLVLQLVTAHLTARLAADLTASIREGTFSDYVRASWAIQAAEQESDVQDLLVRHVNRATGAVTMLAAGLAALFSLLALVGSALVVDPLAAALVIVDGALLFPILRPMTTKAKRAASDQVEAGRNYGVRSLEAVDLSVEIRSFGVSDEVASRLVIATAAEVRPVYLSVLLNRVVNAAYQVAALLILLAGLFAVDKLVTRPLASLGAIVIILVRSLNQSAALQSTYHSMSETLPFAQRLLAERERFRNSIPPQGSTKIAGADRLRFEHVSYHYVEGRPALTDVSFEVEAGQAVGIIGPSGSGKSTLIQLLLRLRHADEGCYTIGGVNATEFDNDSWFSNVAFVPQDCRVFNDTIEENIRFFRMDATHDDIVDAARRAHIHGEIVGMPDGYQTVLGSRGGALSGGQRQRIAIARALVRRPTILVLDEPTSALDMRSESLVHETFTQLKGSVTLFVIAHRLSTLNTCDRIMVLGDGRLQAFGLREELERESGFYRDALELSRIRS